MNIATVSTNDISKNSCSNNNNVAAAAAGNSKKSKINDQQQSPAATSPLPVIRPDNFINAADHSLLAVYCFVKNFIG